jgi:hypothetical protein
MKKHKHYQQMRAMADGWEVKEQWGNGFWALSSYITSDESLKYRIVPDKDGWIPWYRQEGARPNLPEGQKVEWEATDGLVGASGVGTLNWNGSTPVARYRLIAEPKNKVKMWQWIIVETGMSPRLTNYFYTEAEIEIQADNHEWESVVKAEWAEIEVKS